MSFKKPEEPFLRVLLVVVTISDHSPLLSFSICTPKGITCKHYIQKIYKPDVSRHRHVTNNCLCECLHIKCIAAAGQSNV